jgi:hypothetical protein
METEQVVDHVCCHAGCMVSPHHHLVSHHRDQRAETASQQLGS